MTGNEIGYEEEKMVKDAWGCRRGYLELEVCLVAEIIARQK